MHTDPLPPLIQPGRLFPCRSGPFVAFHGRNVPRPVVLMRQSLQLRRSETK